MVTQAQADAGLLGVAATTPPLAWRFLIRGVHGVLRLLFGWRVRVRVIGDVPDAREPAVVVVNHTGSLEPFLVAHAVWQATGHWVQPLAKAELFAVPVLGWLGERAGGIEVARQSEDGRGNAYGAAIARLHEGGTVYVAPEGTHTHDGELLPLRRGAARLALEAGVPVMVVTTFGGQRAYSPVAKHPHRGVLFDVVIEQLEVDPDEDAASLTGRVAATLIDRGVQLRDEYPDAQPDAPWWPPYSRPAEPSRTGRENLELYREQMAEAVEQARARMAELAAERDLEARVHGARDRARTAAETARSRAVEIGEQLRRRADELVELARNGHLGEELHHRVDELAGQARLIAEHATELRVELRELRDQTDEDADDAGDHDARDEGDDQATA